jgi:hypothetical protein
MQACAVALGFAADALPNDFGEDRLEDGPDVLGDVGHEVSQFHRWDLQGTPLYIRSRQLPARVLSGSSLSAFNLQVPPGLQKVLDGMLAKDPALRYATPGEAARELRPFLTG